MKKKILTLLLAATLIGSPVAYADEAASEGGEASAPAAVSVEVAAAPEAATAADSTPAAAAETADSSTPAAVETTGNASEEETTETEVASSNTEESAEETANAAEAVTYDTYSPGNTGTGSASASEEGVVVTITEISKENQESNEPATEESEAAADAETPEDELPLTANPEPAPTVEVSPDKYIPTDSDTVVTYVSIPDPVETTGENSGKTITLSDIELGNMPTNGYQYLKFTFTDAEDGTLYEGYIAGITVYSVAQEGSTVTTDEKVVNLVAAIADHYYANQAFYLTDTKSMVEQYGLSINSIDTEKIASSDYTPEPEDTDTDLCWAASASNMIEFTGWDNLVDAGLALTDEDAVFDYFMESFTDIGSQQEAGIKWFMNGTNPNEDTVKDNVVYYNTTEEAGTIKHNCYDEEGTLKFYYTNSDIEKITIGKEDFMTKSVYYTSDGQAIFYYLKSTDNKVKLYYDTGDNLLFLYANGNYYDAETNPIDNPGMAYGIGNGSSQEKLESTDHQADVSGKNGNLLSEYAEENVADYNYLLEGDSLDGLYEAAMELKDETATGLAIHFFLNDGSYAGGHAVTLFGYIKDALSEGWESLKALFITDSDNNRDVTTTREGAIDTLTMCELTVDNIDQRFYEPKTLLLQNYYKPEYGVTVPILGYSVLRCPSTVTKEETKGTKDSVNTVDYAVTNLQVLDVDGYPLDTYTDGDTLVLYTELQNRSYANLSKYTDPYIVLNYILSCDGEEIQTIRYEIEIDTTKTGAPYSKIVAQPALPISGAGNYSLTVSIQGIYANSAHGHPIRIREAYFTNNDYNDSYMFTVKENPNRGGGETYQNQGKAIPVIARTIEAGSKGDHVIELGEMNGEVSVVKLNGEALSAGDYTITYNPDGTVSITFSEAFLQTLLPGMYTFRLLDASGNTLTIVQITIR